MLNQHRKCNETQTKKRAFSIIELAIALGIVSILFYAASSTSTILMQKAAIIEAQSLTKNSVVNNTPDLLFWIETSLPDSFLTKETDDGETISIWRDLSINKNHMIQNTQNNKPIYVSQGIGKLPSVLFNEHFMSTDEFLQNTSFTVFIVFERLSLTTTSNAALLTSGIGSSYNWFFGNRNSTNPDQGLFRVYEGTTARNYNANDFFSNVAGGDIPTIAALTFMSNGGTQTVYKNGSQVGQSGTRNFNLPNTSGFIRIGRWKNLSQSFHMNLSELIIFNRVLSANETNNIEKYLSKKYNVALE